MSPTYADVEAFLQHGAVVRADFRWSKSRENIWKASATVEECYEGAPVRLYGTANAKTGSLSYALIWSNCRIRGLDRFGPSHPNPDGQRLPCPHKHRWTDEYGDEEAYIPGDIFASDRNGVLLEFLQECNVRFEGTHYDFFVHPSFL